jgi:hypothetical protein
MFQSLSDVALIYLVLVVLYFVESVAWIRVGCTAFVSYFGRFAAPTRCRKLIGNESGSITTFGPAMFDATIIAEACPLSLTGKGLLGFTAATSIAGDRPFCSETVCSWEDISSIRRVEREFWIHDRLLCRMGSVAAADDLWESLRKLAPVTPDQRLVAIERFIDQQFDVTFVNERIQKWNSSTKHLRRWATILFFWIFVVGVVRYQGWFPAMSGPGTLVSFLLCLFIIWWMTCVLQFFAHRKLYPGAKLNRAKHTFTAIVSPAAAMRATDHLARNLIGMRHPLAVAMALLPKDQVSELAISVLRDLRYPKLPVTPSSATEWAEEADQYRATLAAGVIRFCQTNSLPVGQFDLPPLRSEAESVSYCPRCHQEFHVLEAVCSPCGNRESVAFAGSS